MHSVLHRGLVYEAMVCYDTNIWEDYRPDLIGPKDTLGEDKIPGTNYDCRSQANPSDCLGPQLFGVCLELVLYTPTFIFKNKK